MGNSFDGWELINVLHHMETLVDGDGIAHTYSFYIRKGDSFANVVVSLVSGIDNAPSQALIDELSSLPKYGERR